MNAEEIYQTGAGNYEIIPNQWGVKALALAYDSEGVILTVDGVTLHAGYGGYIRNSVSLTHEEPHIAEARAAWGSPNELALFVLCTQTTARFTYRLLFESDFVTVRRTTPIFFNNARTDIVYYGRKIN